MWRLLFLATAISSFSQFASIEPATNRVDWIPGVTVGVFGGIPSRATSVSLPAGSSVATIQAAINSAASNTIVRLVAGNYTISSTINLKSGVTLKGAANYGSVLNMSGGSTLRRLGDSTVTAASSNIDATSLTKGATNLVLTAGGPTPTASQFIDILMDNDTNRVQIFNGATNKMIVDTRRVVAVSGGGLNVQVWPPISVTFLAANNPKYRVKTGAQIEYAGFEDLYLVPDSSISYPVYTAHAFSCWSSNVLITNIANVGHYEFATLQSEIRHSDVKKGSSGGDGYGVSLDVESSTWDGVNCAWIEDNIWDGLYHGIIASGWSASAVTFNYSTNEHAPSGLISFPTASQNLAHSAGGRMNLIEGNWGSAYLTTDIIHGNTTEETLWRNRFVGYANAVSSTNAHMPMLWLGKGSYWYAAAGNVFGASWWSAPGANRVYKYTGATWASASGSDNGGILFLGYTGPGADEAKVGTTFTGYQNYDFYHSAIFDETVVPGSPTVDDSIIYPAGRPNRFAGLSTWPPISPTNPTGSPLLVQAGYRAWNGSDPGATYPTISSVANQAIAQDTSTGVLPFTIGDPVVPASSLTVAVTSSNHALADDADCVLGGVGANRTVTVTPNIGQSGVTTIKMIVTNPSLLTATNTFTVTVSGSLPIVTGNGKLKGNRGRIK